MKIIRNNIIPFKGFVAINLFGYLFIRKDYKIDEILLNHEKIHSSQMKDLGYVLFYILYVLEWLFRYFFTKDAFSNKAYRNISFEQEAYENQNDFNYLTHRSKYAMWI